MEDSRAGANSCTDWPAMTVRETRGAKRNETKRHAVQYQTGSEQSRARADQSQTTWSGVEMTMCKNPHCSPRSKLQSRMHDAHCPIDRGALPAHLGTLFGKWASADTGDYVQWEQPSYDGPSSLEDDYGMLGFNALMAEHAILRHSGRRSSYIQVCAAGRT